MMGEIGGVLVGGALEIARTIGSNELKTQACLLPAPHPSVGPPRRAQYCGPLTSLGARLLIWAV